MKRGVEGLEQKDGEMRHGKIGPGGGVGLRETERKMNRGG